MKRLCAKAALELVPDEGVIGLGGGETIGYLDKEMQEKTIGFAIEQLEDEIFQMKDQVIKNCKMYRSLGLSCSLLIVIILV